MASKAGAMPMTARGLRLFIPQLSYAGYKATHAVDDRLS